MAEDPEVPLLQNQQKHQHHAEEQSSASLTTAAQPPSSATSSSQQQQQSRRSGRNKKKSQRKPPSQAKLRMESMANSIDHKIAIAFAVILLLYSSISIGTWIRLESSEYNDHSPVLRDAVTDRSVVMTHQTEASPDSQGKKQVPAPPVVRSTIKADEIADVSTLQHTFPVHAGHDLEEIDHPGVLMGTPSAIQKTRSQHPEIKTKMKVPKFWRPIAYGPEGVREFLGQKGQRLITPEEAAQIGSFDDNGLETIYVSIASYRDPECRITLEDMYDRADHPERIRVAIIDQLAYEDPVAPCDKPLKPCEEDPNQGLCKYSHLIDRFAVPAISSVGPVFARHLAHRMYRGEYFAMQLDSHVRFIEHWDVDVVSQWKSAKNEMGILSVYLSDLNGSIDPVTHANKHPTRPIMCKTDYESKGKMKHLRHGQQPEGLPGIHGEPTLHPFWAAGFSFARGHFVVQVPYDQFQPMVSQKRRGVTKNTLQV